jgi:hypothetical protein
MTTIHQTALALVFAAASMGAQAAARQGYVYTPAAGVHEVKYFHGCWDNNDIEKRPKVEVVMNNVATGDVEVVTRPHETGKPSTEMITFKLKNADASLSVQFRSNDGAHCQQGVHSIVFKNATVHSLGQLNALR